MVDKRYGNSAPGKSTITDWYAEFKCSCINTDDAECSGLPKSAVVAENITKLRKIVLCDRKLKLREIARIFGDAYFVFEVCAVFAHTRPKTTTRRGFRALFGAV